MNHFFSNFHKRHTLEAFENEFARTTVHSEIIRSRIIGGFALVMILLILFQYIIFAVDMPEIKQFRSVMFLTMGGLFFLFIYEVVYQGILHFFYQTKRSLPELPRYINALIEVSVPTFGIYQTSHLMAGPLALQSPAIFVYFIFIILSTLRLNWRLSLWTGFVAALEYSILSFYLIENTPDLNQFMPVLVSSIQYFSRSALLLIAGIAAAFVSHTIINRVREAINQLGERNQIKEMFGQYVSPEVVNRLLEQKELDSEMRHVAILFFDIRNFTSFSESHSPIEVVTYLNSVFEIVVDVVKKNNGIINKFLGDGFMAIFGAPLATGNDSKNALRTALEIKETLDSEKLAGNLTELEFGIGIHAGQAITGNVGTKERKEYTIIGDSVNLASRIEQLNKAFLSQILVSRKVYEDVTAASTGGFSYVFPEGKNLGEVAVKGKEILVEIYRFA